MKKIIASLTLLFLFLNFTHAYNRADLDKLLETHFCPGANLASAKLSGMNLKGANLKNADLSNADFTDALLTSADLSGAKLTGARFENTTMPNGDKYSGKIEDYKGPLSVGSRGLWGDSTAANFNTPIDSKENAGKFINSLMNDDKHSFEDESDDEDE